MNDNIVLNKNHVYRLFKNLFFAQIIFIILTLSLPAFANSFSLRISLDNKLIQTYKNRVGRWVENRKNKSFIAEQCKEFGCNEKEVLEINNNDISSNFLFFPFSKNYYENLLKQGHGRRLLDFDIRSLAWPVENAFITSRFGKRGLILHNGIDLSATIGTPVLAVHNGIVIKAGWAEGYGNAVFVQHDDGKESVYAHLSHVYVREGDNVQVGQILGMSGNTGRSTGPHLHFEIRYSDVPLNPEDFLTEAIFSENVMYESIDGVIIEEKIDNVSEGRLNSFTNL